MQENILLTLIRGAPGSGKSTLAKKLVETGRADVHLEADNFFIKDGVYKYDPSKIKEAHEWCKGKALESLLEGKRVVVSNTFTKLWELEGYIQQLFLATTPDEDGNRPLKISVAHCEGRYENIHGVPADKVELMRRNFEEFTKDSINDMMDKFHKELDNVH